MQRFAGLCGLPLGFLPTFLKHAMDGWATLNYPISVFVCVHGARMHCLFMSSLKAFNTDN